VRRCVVQMTDGSDGPSRAGHINRQNPLRDEDSSFNSDRNALPTKIEPCREAGAWGSIALLITIAAIKTLLTKYIFVHQVKQPVAYSLLSAFVTLLLVSCHGFGSLQLTAVLRLVPVALAIAIDLGLSNIAISRLPLALQQAIASTIPAATILLESVVRRRCKPLIVYLVITTLCFGAVLGHLGSLPVLVAGSGDADKAYYWAGEAAMMLAVVAAACKYVFAKDLLHAYREEVGALRLLLWIECMLCAVLLPWSLVTEELPQLLHSGLSAVQWGSLCSAAALGGYRFYVELVVLRYWSATTLSAANLSAHSLIIVCSIPVFGTPVTPFLVAGTAVTIAASLAYGWIKIVGADLTVAKASDASRLGLW